MNDIRRRSPLLTSTMDLPHVAGMPQRVASRLRPHGETMRLPADGNALDLPAYGIDDVDDVVVAAREPELFAVDAHVAHVGAPSTRNRARGDDLPRGEVDHRYAAFTNAPPAADLREATVGYIELDRKSVV